VNKGIGCETCHGRVDQMPLTWQENSLLMQWCLDCHRQPELYVRPREAVFQMGWKPPADQLAVGRRLVKEYKIRKPDGLLHMPPMNLPIPGAAWKNERTRPEFRAYLEAEFPEQASGLGGSGKPP